MFSNFTFPKQCTQSVAKKTPTEIANFLNDRSRISCFTNFVFSVKKHPTEIANCLNNRSRISWFTNFV